MRTDTTERALRELEHMAAGAHGRRASWIMPAGQPMNKWVGYHQHNSQIAWKVYADNIQVYMLGPARAGVAKSQAQFTLFPRHPNQTMPDDVQDKIIRFIEQLPRLDFMGAIDEAIKLQTSPGVAKYIDHSVENLQQHTPQRFPVTKMEMSTADGELLATNREFRVIIRARREIPGDRDVTYFASVKGDLAVALPWVVQNKQRIPRMRGRDIIKELRAAGFKGDYR